MDIFGRAFCLSRFILAMKKLLIEVLNCLKNIHTVMLAKLGMLVGVGKIKFESTVLGGMVET